MAITTARAADREIDRLARANQDAFDRLLQLENHTGHRLLAAGAARGTTERRWNAVREQLAELWDLHRRRVAALDEARRVRARRRRPAVRDLDDIDRLLAGAWAVGSPVLLETLADEVRAVLDAADRVCGALLPCLERCDENLAAAADHAAWLGAAPQAAVARLRERVDQLREVAVGDPLSRWTGTAVDDADARTLVADCTRTRTELADLVALRDAAADVLAGLDGDLGRIEELQRRADLLRAEVALKVAGPPPGSPVPARVEALRGELTRVAGLAESGDWAEFGTAVAAARSAVAAALSDAAAAVDAVRRPLRVRAELRARLSLYHAKSLNTGLGEDAVLDRTYRGADALLWTAPCDLAAAHDAVETYRRQVNAAPTPRRDGR